MRNLNIGVLLCNFIIYLNIVVHLHITMKSVYKLTKYQISSKKTLLRDMFLETGF